jgi:1-acyl-sn-glycerol-3-phosphate acyltransferase
MPPMAFLARPERWLWAIHRHRGTLSASPNFGYEVSCRRIDDKSIQGLDLSSWRLAFNGAEPVSRQTIANFITRFEPYGFRKEASAPVYGLAESSVGLAFPPLNRGPIIDHIQRDHFFRTGEAIPAQGDEEALEFVACGQPLAGHQIRIVDPAGRELPERQQGRLEFKGPSVTSGYLHNPDQTRRLFHGDWLDSGDLAYIADGDVYITSRVKDIIIRGGRNVYPHELEEAIGNIDGIRKGCVAVFGSLDRKERTERVVVLAESRVLKPEARAALRKKITNIGVDLLGMPPDDIILAPPRSVLKTSSGKVRRSATRQLYERGLIGKKKRAVWLQLLHMTLAGLPPLFRRLCNQAGNYLYAAYCWAVGGLLGLPLWLMVSVSPSIRICWPLAHHCARLLAFLTGTKLDIRGMEHLADAGAKVLVSNHMSYMDALVLTASMPVPCSFVAKAELASNMWLRMPLAHLETVFVERFDAEQGVEDAKKISQLVGSGKRLLFFAEGTLHRMPGLLPFQMGAFLTAANNRTGVISITLRGTRNKLRADSWFPRKGPVRVIFSQPIMPEGDDWKSALKLRNAVRSEILHQLGEPDLACEFSSLAQMDIKPPEKEKPS